MKRFLVIIIIVAGAIFLSSGNEASAEKRARPLNPETRKEVGSLIQGALMDYAWMKVDSEEELTGHLERFYAGRYLEELRRAVWEFISIATDWHGETRTDDAEFLFVNSRWAVTRLALWQDWPSGEVLAGEGVFVTYRLPWGWRIIWAHYHWQER